jgi:hypothetical protein
MKHRQFAICAATLAAAVSVTVAHAQSGMVATTAPAYISGGVGDPDVARLKSQERDYELKLVFTLNEGNYVADVALSLRDAKGNHVIDTVSDGPIFMAKLPPGGYTVSATYEGRTITRKIGVPARGLRTEYLRWPANPATDFAMARSTAQ